MMNGAWHSRLRANCDEVTAAVRAVEPPCRMQRLVWPAGFSCIAVCWTHVLLLSCMN